MAQVIKFGTDGWRAVIATITRLPISSALSCHGPVLQRAQKIRNGIVIGYDARFMSREFAEKAAEVMANAGILVKLADSIVTTPMISLLTKMERAAGGVVITASHNPPKYNGFKIKGDFGGPAHPEMIAKVEKELARVMKLKTVPHGTFTYRQLVDKKKIVPISMKQRYLEDLSTKIDLPRIKAADIRILYDVMYGASQTALAIPPRHHHDARNLQPSFEGESRTAAHNLRSSRSAVKEEHFHIGIATDGDADRIGRWMSRGTSWTPTGSSRCCSSIWSSRKA
jgi:phosphomannomutase